MDYNYSEIVEYLLYWYDRNARILAWRENPRPYYVWVSEIMLQQTRVEAVKDYFDRFLTALPDIPALAEASEDKILKLWEGLGYYNRVRNMQKAAKLVVEQYGGELPADYELLQTLPGIGTYTAGAIASIAFGIPEPCVDGNVLRVCKRIAGSYDDITKESVKRQLTADLRAIMPKERPGDFNQSLMELGAMICLPNGKPLCEQCPVMHLCKAFHAGIELELPVKPAKKERRVEERTVFVLKQEQEGNGEYEVALHRREKKGLLAGMWELPAVEGHLTKEQVQSCFPKASVKSLPDGKHIFSHVEWRMKCYEVEGKVMTAQGERLLAWQSAFQTMLQKEYEITFFSERQIKEEISLPSAFESYRKYLKNETGKGRTD